MRSTTRCRRSAGWSRSSPARCRMPRASGARRPRALAERVTDLAVRHAAGAASCGFHRRLAAGRQRLRRSVQAGRDRRAHPQEPRDDRRPRGQQRGRSAVPRSREARRHAMTSHWPAMRSYAACFVILRKERQPGSSLNRPRKDLGKLLVVQFDGIALHAAGLLGLLHDLGEIGRGEAVLSQPGRPKPTQRSPIQEMASDDGGRVCAGQDAADLVKPRQKTPMSSRDTDWDGGSRLPCVREDGSGAPGHSPA